MKNLTIGVVIIGISALGYFSNWLNWRFLNYKITQWLYYLGAFVHETSHAILCLLTGAKVSEYKIFVRQPRVVHSKPRIPIIGSLLVSIAPIFGGLLVLFLINKYFLMNEYLMPEFSNWHLFLQDLWQLLIQIDFFKWQTFALFFLFLNMGAMLGPSLQDLKNIWWILIILLFIPSNFFVQLGLLALALILINILLQGVLIILISILKFFWRKIRRN